jgi:hypothetical protein
MFAIVVSLPESFVVVAVEKLAVIFSSAVLESSATDATVS